MGTLVVQAGRESVCSRAYTGSGDGGTLNPFVPTTRLGLGGRAGIQDTEFLHFFSIGGETRNADM